ncbi:2'-5' RNA ligase family protein [Abyssalbus ytuae]|uniref:2'-5' RNA ligase family protein n=1 Tax=Abyssalbus ytuae TaxID=2926907 RepID=A0A9E7A1A5_9FLAO|nr:2'-5' RNA ligase family protein [Abyssalbus ytuae]UOB19162.1 2'-5' RNA ligase family protein [Abyssalbus ytuae]
MYQESQHLYFIALIPPETLCEEIKNLKEEMRSRFNTKHALKSPAHITLQMPFKRPVKDENEIVNQLRDFASLQSTFHIGLKGFDCFKPRVIFIKIENHLPIIKLHKQLNQLLKKELDFKDNELTAKIHPHITIATRDLSIDGFKNAWPEYDKRDFKRLFTVKSLFLLKHNGKSWDIYKEFPFNNKNI